MIKRTLIAAAFTLAGVTAASAEPLIWGVDVEKFEYRLGEQNGNAYAWDFDALVGTDEMKFVWRSEAEYATDERSFEVLDNQARVQIPVSTFFDGVVGVLASTPKGPDRFYGVLGLHGLAKQWFEVDMDLYVSNKPFARAEIDYEGLITNRVTLTPSWEVTLPLKDDPVIGLGAGGIKSEIGLRLSYDLVDRLLSPYVGVHYESTYGDTARYRSEDGKSRDATYLVTGLKMLF
ncbi:copper resistance protein B [Rhodospirillaceae bacterium KN72]|uniref:Copper resistance protein B n=1 Tax=Pacificispira spongiicola TaxID=2729598 RepID=A0A7Y0HDQ7_9PROT|nr:copper resistance protein B [Pacificispira spongiicola]NMM43910.1 copper resistance protein B [Pacificispira spongiicola]